MSAAEPLRPATPRLRLAGLGRRFGGLTAAENVSFDVAAGSITALIGPNGAGKTTVFNLVTNVVPADAGEALLDGRSLRGLAPERIAALGLVRTFQTARVFPGMTALENLLVGAHLGRRSGALAQMLRLAAALREERALVRRAEALLDVLGLLPCRDRHAIDLPMGAQKLLEVGRALMSRPRLLLLDEPAAGLNDAETVELAQLLRALGHDGVTLLVVEHNMSLVMTVADHVVVMDSGTVIADGTPAEVRRLPRVIAAYLGSEAAP